MCKRKVPLILLLSRKEQRHSAPNSWQADNVNVSEEKFESFPQMILSNSSLQRTGSKKRFGYLLRHHVT